MTSPQSPSHLFAHAPSLAFAQARFLTSLGDVLQEAKIAAPKFRSSALTLGAFDTADAIAPSAFGASRRPAPALGPEGVLESPQRGDRFSQLAKPKSKAR